MHIIIITEIYGLTQAISSLAQELSSSNMNVDNQNPLIKPGFLGNLDPSNPPEKVTIIDPYQGVKKTFANEAMAYQGFINECGHEAYREQVKETLSAISAIEDEIVIIAFSVGASAAWQVIESKNSKNDNKVKHLIGFYPSQIRHHLDLVPACPVTLIFPVIELHFDVDKVIKTLSEKHEVTCIKTSYKHGFINPLSHNYSAAAANSFNQVICQTEKLTQIDLFRKLLNNHINRSFDFNNKS